MTTVATEGLAHAWAARADRALRDLGYAETAPALFKPEFVEQRRADYLTAVAWARYWTGVGR